jgi:hypothetical protein
MVAKRSTNGTQFLGLVVKFKDVILHRDIELGEKYVSTSLGKMSSSLANGRHCGLRVIMLLSDLKSLTQHTLPGIRNVVGPVRLKKL